MTTPYHARYFAHELTRQHGPGSGDRLSMALFDACVDLNPHQIDAAAFALRNPLSKGVSLEWKQRHSDYPFHSSQLSDGTLRFIALATALLQPAPPATMLFDEPELGLHPHALNTLSALVKSASARGQIVVATQSPTLLDEFEPEDVVVVDRQGAESIFARPDPQKLKAWLEEYRLGEVWWKNVMGGGPVHA